MIVEQNSAHHAREQAEQIRDWRSGKGYLALRSTVRCLLCRRLMVPVWLLAVALAAGPAPAAPASEYDLVWTAFAREVRYQQGESQPVAAGERSGRARARLISVRAGVLRLEWRGAGGGRTPPARSARPPPLCLPPPRVNTGTPTPPPLPAWRL